MKPLSSFYRSHDSNFVSAKQETVQDFISQFHKNLQAAATRKQSGFYDDISQMFGCPKKKYQSVQAAVEDMITRTGLQNYIQNITAKNTENKKVANQETGSQSSLFPALKPTIRENIFHFIKNKINDSHGRVPIPVLQDDILSTFKNDGISPEDAYSESLARYINQGLIAEQIKNPLDNKSDHNIGKNLHQDADDGSNNDFFRGLNPG